MGWQYQNGQVTWVDDKNSAPPLQTPQNTTNNPAYGATPTLPGAGGEYVPPGSPVNRTNGAIQQAGNTPMQSPLTGASGAPPMQTAQNTTFDASPYNTPPMTSPLTGAPGATGTGDVTGDPASPLPAQGPTSVGGSPTGGGSVLPNWLPKPTNTFEQEYSGWTPDQQQAYWNDHARQLEQQKQMFSDPAGYSQWQRSSFDAFKASPDYQVLVNAQAAMNPSDPASMQKFGDLYKQMEQKYGYIQDPNPQMIPQDYNAQGQWEEYPGQLGGNLWPNTGGPEASASGEFNVDLPGLPSGREDLAQLLTMQQLGQQQGNPMLELLQGLSVRNLGGPFGLTPSEEQMAYGRGEAMLKQSEAEQQKALIEEMNRRGILTSGITVDQMAGLAGKGQLARQNLLSDLLISNAQNQQSQRNAALGTAAGMYGVGQAGQQQNFGNLMGLLGNAQGWQGQQFGQQQQVYNDALNNYYKQTQLESQLNTQARQEEMQPYQLLMQLAGMGEGESSGIGTAGNLALGAQGQALANQETGTDWGSILGMALPSLIKLLAL